MMARLFHPESFPSVKFIVYKKQWKEEAEREMDHDPEQSLALSR